MAIIDDCLLGVITGNNYFICSHGNNLITGSIADASDFDASTQRITFLAADGLEMDVPITIFNDNVPEDEEMFSVELAVPSGSEQEGLVANGYATVTILDNDSELIVEMVHMWFVACTNLSKFVSQSVIQIDGRIAFLILL